LFTCDTNWQLYAGGAGINSGVAGDTNWHTITGVLNGGSSVLRLDGTQIGSGNAGSDAMGSGASAWMIGAGYPSFSNPTNCQFGEILVYDSTITGTNLTNVENYLRAKWGTP
jgi:hypothetical protein